MKNQHDPRNGTAINRKSVIALAIATVGLLAVIALLSVAPPGVPAVTVAEVVADVEHNVVTWRGENRSGSSCEASYPSGTTHGESDTIPRGPFAVTTPLDEGATVGHAWIHIRCEEDTRVLAREVSTVPCLEDDCTDRSPIVRVTIDPTQVTPLVKSVFDTELPKVVADKGYRVRGPIRSRLSLNTVGRAVSFEYEIIEARVEKTVECPMGGHIAGMIGHRRDGEPLSSWNVRARMDTKSRNPLCWPRDLFEPGDQSSSARRSVNGALRSLPKEVLVNGVTALVNQLTGDRSFGGQMAARLVRGGLASSVSMPRPGVVDVIVWQEQEDHGATRHGPDLAEMPTAWPANGSAGAVTVSYSLINQLLEMLLAERPFRQIAGNRQGPEASPLNAAGQVIREWLAEANRSEWRKIANVIFLEGLDFRVPLAVFPEGDDRIRVFVKGIEIFEDASDGTDAPMRYELRAEGRSSLACPGPGVSSIDDADKDYLRQRLTMQPSSDLGERRDPLQRSATRLGMTAAAWMREESNSLIPTSEFRPLEVLTRAFSGVCLDLSQPVRMGGSSSLLLTAVSIGNVAGGAIQVQFSRSAS